MITYGIRLVNIIFTEIVFTVQIICAILNAGTGYCAVAKEAVAF